MNSSSISNQMLRIIDANLNRLGESLRLLEDIARLLLNDAALSRQLKELRHQLIPTDRALNQRLIQARDSEGDVGAVIEVPQPKERQLPEAITANSRRAEQSLRVLEELVKAPGTGLDPEKFNQARFSIYAIEQVLTSKMLRKDKVSRISGLYAVIDTGLLKGRNHLEVAEQVISGGARIIQLRDKTTAKGELLTIARKLKSLCLQQDALFVVNDHLDIALASDADGLHLGQDDLPADVARRLLSIDKIIGCSVTSVAQAIAARSQGADYIAAGAAYSTTSKEGVEVVGLETVTAIKKAVSLPLVAIGGITPDNVAEALSAGADAVAVISAILGAESPEAATRQITSRIKEKR